jgi:hypothetical protein
MHAVIGLLLALLVVWLGLKVVKAVLIGISTVMFACFDGFAWLMDRI